MYRREFLQLRGGDTPNAVQSCTGQIVQPSAADLPNTGKFDLSGHRFSKQAFVLSSDGGSIQCRPKSNSHFPAVVKSSTKPHVSTKFADSRGPQRPASRHITSLPSHLIRRECQLGGPQRKGWLHEVLFSLAKGVETRGRPPNCDEGVKRRASSDSLALGRSLDHFFRRASKPPSTDMTLQDPQAVCDL